MPPRINGRSLLATSKSSLRKRPLKSISPDLPSSLSISKNPKRALHTTISRQDVETQERSRWEAPPPRMTAPFRSKPPVLGNDFRVNEDPYRLDEAYIRVLGPGGDSMLTDEVKWLAVTHKSFDHGRRGFNDKLAFFGMKSSFTAILGSFSQMAWN